MNYRFNPAFVTVDYDELKAPEVTLSEFGYVAVRTLRCAYADRFKLARELWGRFGSNDSGEFWLMEPDKYILDDDSPPIIVPGGAATPGGSVLYCSNVEVGEWGDPSGGDSAPAAREHIKAGARGNITYLFAKVVATYTSAPWFYEERFESGGEFVGVSGGRGQELYWRSDHDKIDKQITRPVVRVPGGIWTVTLLGVWAVPDEILSMKGKVNSVAMESPNLVVIDPATGAETKRVFPAGTVLYNDATITEASMIYAFSFDGKGRSFSRVELNFTVKENGHNNFFRPGEGAAGTWDALDHDEAGTSPYNPYQTADLNQVIGAA